jgi:hypothetical protein
VREPVWTPDHSRVVPARTGRFERRRAAAATEVIGLPAKPSRRARRGFLDSHVARGSVPSFAQTASEASTAMRALSLSAALSVADEGDEDVLQ